MTAMLGATLGLSRQTFEEKSVIFAHVAEASLDNAIFLVCTRAIRAFTSRNISGSFFSKWHTELYFIGHFFTQMFYLKQFGATFSEYFFGLKRASLKNKGSQLSKQELILSLIFTSVSRYVMEKMNQKNQNLQKKSLLNPIALINIANYMALAAQYIRFLSGKSDAVTPFHSAAGVKLEYRNDVSSQTGNTLREFISQALQNSLGLSAFILQFSQWWQTGRSKTANRINVPPPPVTREPDFGTHCHLCDFRMKDMTLLSLSGNVFCHKCISDFVEKFKKCPITNIPSDLSKLIQLQE